MADFQGRDSHGKFSAPTPSRRSDLPLALRRVPNLENGRCCGAFNVRAYMAAVR